jgi:hypothetical protein
MVIELLATTLLTTENHMRFTPQLLEAIGAQVPVFHKQTRPLTTSDLSTTVPNDVPLLACYQALLKQASDGRRRAQIIQNNRRSYYSEAAIECRAA